MCVMFQDELFEVEKSTFVRDFLTNLDDCFPGVFGVRFCTVGTLLVCYYEFTFESLLEDGRCECFFLDSEFDSNSTGMRFCPDKSGIDQTDLV